MSRDLAPTFASIDAMDADKFVAHLTPDVVFRFGNGDPVVGREAVKAAIEGFWTTIAGLTHNVKNTWDVGDTSIAQIDIDYRRHDGKVVTVPNVDILVFDGNLVRDWQIYLDLTPVFA